MEQTIRERRFGSLSARKKQKNEEINPVYEQMNKAPARPETSGRNDADMTNLNRTISSPSSSSEINASTSVETLSDMSVTTPSGVPVMVSDMKKHNEANGILFEAPPLQLVMPSRPKERAMPSPKPVLAPSLSKASDFAFDRYSKVIDPPAMEEVDLDDVEIFEVCEVSTPIEVATPITYIRPNRPSMVSIFNILNKHSNRESRNPLPAKPEVPPRNPERHSVSRRMSGFMAGEATPFEVPDLPENALTMISNASQTDLSTFSRYQEPTLKKQKSKGLLSKALKYAPSRMSGRVQSGVPSSHQSRPQSPQEAITSRHGPASSSNFPPLPLQPPPALADRFRSNQHSSPIALNSRPQTAAPSTSPPPTPTGVTALPPCTESFSQRGSLLVGSPSSHVKQLSHKKSMSALRSRSDSIGTALMSITRKSSVGRSKGRSIAREALASPGLPHESPRTVLVTPPKKSVDLKAFPTPPLTARPQSNHRSLKSFSRPMRASTAPLHGLGVTVN